MLTDDSSRYQVVQAGFWWRIKVGDADTTYGRFYTQREAEKMASLLLREFRNGKFVGDCRSKNPPTQAQNYGRAVEAEATAELHADNERLRGLLREARKHCPGAAWSAQTDSLQQRIDAHLKEKP